MLFIPFQLYYVHVIYRNISVVLPRWNLSTWCNKWSDYFQSHHGHVYALYSLWLYFDCTLHSFGLEWCFIRLNINKTVLIWIGIQQNFSHVSELSVTVIFKWPRLVQPCTHGIVLFQKIDQNVLTAEVGNSSL